MYRTRPRALATRSLVWTIAILGVSASMVSANNLSDHLNAPSVTTGAQSKDSADVVGVVARFHAALTAGDTATAMALLSNDVMILESGGVETRDEYLAHHLPADIAFARAVPSERSPIIASVQNDVAWATGTSSTRGEYRGRQIDSAGAELMVLTKQSGGWQIRAIHWSARARRPQGG